MDDRKGNFRCSSQLSQLSSNSERFFVCLSFNINNSLRLTLSRKHIYSVRILRRARTRSACICETTIPKLVKSESISRATVPDHAITAIGEIYATEPPIFPSIARITTCICHQCFCFAFPPSGTARTPSLLYVESILPAHQLSSNIARFGGLWTAVLEAWARDNSAMKGYVSACLTN